MDAIVKGRKCNFPSNLRTLLLLLFSCNQKNKFLYLVAPKILQQWLVGRKWWWCYCDGNGRLLVAMAMAGK